MLNQHAHITFHPRSSAEIEEIVAVNKDGNPHGITSGKNTGHRRTNEVA
jgi:hypothetical protein